MSYLLNPSRKGLSLGSILPHGQMVLVKSRILDFETQKPIENASIQLESNIKVGAITNHNGFFEIYANPNDNLIIRHLTYETYKVPVSEIEQTDFLIPKTNQLKEVDLGIIKKKNNTALYLGLGVLFSVIISSSIKNKSDENE